jgi:hypothetical protein
MRRRRRTRKRLPDNLKETRGYWNFKEEALSGKLTWNGLWTNCKSEPSFNRQQQQHLWPYKYKIKTYLLITLPMTYFSPVVTTQSRNILPDVNRSLDRATYKSYASVPDVNFEMQIVTSRHWTRNNSTFPEAG